MRAIPRAALTIFSLLSLAPFPARSQEKPAEIVREKTVYVPYEKLENVFE